ncbi:V-type ATP synthase subunit D [Thioalkalivibrio sp. XN279]|uniref:V-type ATP synthase subunit D n=1 Tax=Thioalkalivibrio sp. XN279 TaxID=2714953 RepID=UPI00140A010B|nr:V-type ATP synthase subunit D [Thioalkalivibrio sp. XN279]NHA15425.1 ATPase [Thioalkalivibrio sp. XN279]
MPEAGLSPSRSAFLELKEERQLVREGFEFLDEKRVILAQEMLRRLKAWKAARERYDALHEEAAAALARAVGRHGLDGIGIYPAPRMDNAALARKETRFLGVNLLDGEFDPGWGEKDARPPHAVNPSPEAERCREAFAALLPLGFELAVMRASLERLVREYVRTERRARALENVVLPEIEHSLRFMDEQLEAMDQEEAIRVRNAGR